MSRSRERHSSRRSAASASALEPGLRPPSASAPGVAPLCGVERLFEVGMDRGSSATRRPSGIVGVSGAQAETHARVRSRAHACGHRPPRLAGEAAHDPSRDTEFSPVAVADVLEDGRPDIFEVVSVDSPSDASSGGRWHRLSEAKRGGRWLIYLTLVYLTGRGGTGPRGCR